MEVKVKKLHNNHLVKSATSAEVKEVIIREDIEDPKAATIMICFRGTDGSGIIELERKEFDILSKKVKSSINLVKDAKVLKFKK